MVERQKNKNMKTKEEGKNMERKKKTKKGWKKDG